MDLIRMYMNKAFRFTTEMRNAVIAYANNQPYSIQIIDSPSDYKGYLKTSIMVHVSIDEKKHPEVMELFGKLKKGQRCAFIKTITRRCMTELPLSTYFAGDGIIMSKEAARKLEEAGTIVEGNNQLVNKIVTTKPEQNKKNETVKKQNLSQDDTYVPTYDNKEHGNNKANAQPTLNPLTAPDGQHKVVQAVSNDTYIPDDIPYAEDIVKDTLSTGSSTDFKPDVSDDEENDAPNFALFSKLAHG